jgi:hypothetical protein
VDNLELVPDDELGLAKGSNKLSARGRGEVVRRELKRSWRMLVLGGGHPTGSRWNLSVNFSLAVKAFLHNKHNVCKNIQIIRGVRGRGISKDNVDRVTGDTTKLCPFGSFQDKVSRHMG